MRSLLILNALSSLVSSQLTQDTFNSIVGNAAEQAGIPDCGVSCLLQAFEYSKASRSCFVLTTNLDCLCDNEDIASGALSCARTVCGSTDTDTFAERAAEICASRWVSQTNLRTASSTSEALSTITDKSTTATVAANPSTTALQTPSSSSTPTLKAQLDESKINTLTTSAKAGIGAGAGAVVLIAMLVGFLLIRRRRQHKNSAPLDVLPPRYEKGEQAELMGSPTPTDAGSKFTMSPMSEMGGGVFETSEARGMSRDVQVQGPVLELGGREPVELPANSSLGDLGQPVPEGRVAMEGGGSERPLSGPIPSASDLYPSPQSRAP